MTGCARCSVSWWPTAVPAAPRYAVRLARSPARRNAVQNDAAARERMTDARPIVAEFLGTAMLLAIVVGSGIMGERLAAGNDAVALLGNTIATGAGLVVLIYM